MININTLIFVAVIGLVYASEADDVEQKKRGAGKPTSLNAIPTGGQKQDYTYSIYTQNPAQASQPSYTPQIQNSFYPSQGASQYYQSTNPSPDSHTQLYPQQPQINLIPPPSTSQFVPLNFLPSSGYQTKYQILPGKSPNGNIQLAIIQPQSFPQHQLLSYPQNIFSAQPQNQYNAQQSQIYSPLAPQNHFAQNYQIPVTQPFVGHPSMFLLTPPSNPSVYNNLLYPNSQVQNPYNYYQSSPQTKYSLYSGSSAGLQTPASNDYDKLPGPIQQNIQKEDNEISVHNQDYITPAESNASYKSAYATSRTSYKN